MWKLLVPLVLLLIGAVLALFTGAAQKPASLTVVNKGDITTLDLTRMSWMQDFRIASCIYEGLVRNDNFTWDYAKVPGVAERWESSPDGLTWTFHLRSTAKWSNSAPVRAQDFVYAWRRALLPDVAGDYANLFRLFKGGRAFFEWRDEQLKRFALEGNGASRPDDAQALWKQTLERFDQTVGIRAADDRTLVLTLEHPCPFLMDVLAFEAMGPLYGPLVDQYQSIDPISARLRTRSDWTRPPLLVTNGPFIVASWRFKQDMRLERNPNYWNASATHLDSILIPSIDDSNASVLAYQTGACDWLSDVMPDYVSGLLADKQRYYAEHREQYDKLVREGYDPVAIDRRMPADPRQNIHTLPTFGTYFYNFNCSPKLADGRVNPFADKRVRRAFAMTIDRAFIAEQIRRRGEPVAGSLTPPDSIAGYTPPKGLPFDPPAARKLLEEAGFPGGKGLATIEILVNSDGAHSTIAQAIKKDWEQHLGVSVRIEQKETKVFKNDLKGKNYMCSRASWFGDFGDPTTFLDISRSDDGNNDRAYLSPAYDALLDRAQLERDAEQRMKILQQAEALVIEEDCAMAPIFHYRQVFMFDPHKVAGISPHPRQKQYMWRMDVLGDGRGADVPQEMPLRPR